MVSKEGRPAARLTARGAVTKARIVAGAASLVRERGVAGTSLDAVMAATGLLYLAILTAFGTDLVARALLS